MAGALSVDAAEGSASPFDARIHDLRGHPGQIAAAAAYRELLANSPINSSHRECGKVQDPYSLRCQPQVMGACSDQIEARAWSMREPTVSLTIRWISDTGEVLPAAPRRAGGIRRHPALAVAEIGALSERRIAPLIDATLSGLPPFLVRDGGVNSGFMIAHVTAAALASENKLLAHPASVDSLPTSANQEDHVSMATFAARKLGDLCENTSCILAIELLAAAQGVDLRAPVVTSERLQRVMREIRARVPHYDIDRYLAPDIAAMTEAVRSGVIAAHAPKPRDDSDQFLLFGATLLVSPCSIGTLSVALLGLAAITAQGAVGDFTARPAPLDCCSLHAEWVILANLLALLVALRCCLVAEQSGAHLLPRIAGRLERRPGAARAGLRDLDSSTTSPPR